MTENDDELQCENDRLLSRIQACNNMDVLEVLYDVVCRKVTAKERKPYIDAVNTRQEVLTREFYRGVKYIDS